MSEIRIGVQVQPQHATYENMRRTWAELDALGADMIFTWDHFFPLNGDPTGCTSSRSRCRRRWPRSPSARRSARS